MGNGCVSQPDGIVRFGFSEALCRIKQGEHVRRAGWNGRNMYVALQSPDEGSKNTLPYLYLVYEQDPMRVSFPQGARVPWLASQTDLLAEDWELAE
ncbi:MAG TPA: DUF2829 domain-containing protein [Spirochaetia bacterium]|nr:DUF2829 domain-containing protein [Spirochaetia bacterium]